MTQTNKRAQVQTCCGQDLQNLLPTRFFKALADPNRIVILGRLADCCGPQSVTEISSCCNVDISVISRHLATLRDAGVVEAEKRGKQVFYQLKGEELAAALRSMADAVEACCTPAENPEEQAND